MRCSSCPAFIIRQEEKTKKQQQRHLIGGVAGRDGTNMPGWTIEADVASVASSLGLIAKIPYEIQTNHQTSSVQL